MSNEQTTELNFKEVDYEIIDGMGPYMDKIYHDIIQNFKFQNILDVGCGNGRFSKAFIDNGNSIDGIDGHEGALRVCKSIGFNNCYYSQNIDTDDLSQVDQSYDLIICKDFLEHILFPDRLLERLHAKLNEGGKIFIHVPNHFPLYYRLKFLFTADLDTQNYFPDRSEWDNPHIRYFTFEGLSKLFNKTGYRIVKDYSNNFFFSWPHLVSVMKMIKIDKFLSKKWPNLFCTGFSVLVEKK